MSQSEQEGDDKILFLGQDLTLKANGRFINSLINLTGYVSIAITIVGIALAVSFFESTGQSFSFTSVFMSDVGAEPMWPMKIFNGAVLLTATLQLIFYFLVAHKCFVLGTYHRVVKFILVFAILASIGRMGSAIVSYNTIHLLHRVLALFYFLSLTAMVGCITWAERKLPVNKVLPIVGSVLVLITLLLTALFVLAFKTDWVANKSPAIWEWLSFLILLVWIFLHTYFLTRNETTEEEKKTSRIFSRHAGSVED